MSKRLGWIAIVLLVAYLCFVGGGWSGIYQPALRLISVLLAGVVVATWQLRWRRDPSLRPRSSLMPAILACLGSLAISTVFSRYPGISLEYVGYSIVLAALYLLLVQLLRDEFFRRRFVPLAAVLFAVVAAAYMIVVVAAWIPWWQALGRIALPPLRPGYESLTFGSPSAVMMAVALLGIPVVASVEWTTRRGVAVVVAALAAIAIVALLSGSRAGWLALASTAVFGVAVLTIRPEGRALIRRFVWRFLGSFAGRLAAAAALVLLIAVAAALTPAILRRAAEGGEGNRLTYLNVATDLFTQSPIVGTGPGTWVIQRIAATPAGGFDDYIPHAHDIYAQTLAELGIVGAAAGVFLIVSLVRLLRRAARSQDAARKRWAWATLLALVYFGVHHGFDFYVNEPTMLFLLALPIAFLDAHDEPSESSFPWLRVRLPSRALQAGAFGIVLGITIGGLALQELPSLKSADAVARANAADWAGADEPARAAAAEDPRISSYLFTAGLTAAHVGDDDAALEYFRLVAERDHLPEAWVNYAAEQLLVYQQNPREFEEALWQALRLGSQRPSIAIAVGELALRLHHIDIAGSALSRAVAIAPSFIADPWWDSPNAAPMRAQIAQRAAEIAPGVAWEIELMMGDAERAHDLADSSIDGSPVHLFIDAWAGDAVAATQLVERCAASPFDRQLLGWCARIERKNGNQAEAERWRYIAGVVDPAAATVGTELRVLDQSSLRSVDPGLAQFWGPFTYRRAVPTDMLVPSLLHLTRL